MSWIGNLHKNSVSLAFCMFLSGIFGEKSTIREKDTRKCLFDKDLRSRIWFLHAENHRAEIIEDFPTEDFHFPTFHHPHSTKTSFNELNLRFFLCFLSTLQLPSCLILAAACKQKASLAPSAEQLGVFIKHSAVFRCQTSQQPGTSDDFSPLCTVKKKVDYGIKFKIWICVFYIIQPERRNNGAEWSELNLVATFTSIPGPRVSCHARFHQNSWKMF